jgi:hypothetical protein
MGSQVPLQYLILPMLSLYLVYPILQGIDNRVNVTRVRETFRRRGLLIIFILSLSSFTVVLNGASFQTYSIPPSETYQINVSVQTVIAGSENWSVAFIFFNYIDDGNHYYVLLSRDGVLELTKVVNYDIQFLTFVKTDLSPFLWHDFKILNLGEEVLVYVDGVHYISFMDEPQFQGNLVLKGSVSAKLAFFKNIQVSEL